MNYEAPTCVICLQDLSHSLTVISCGHIFHSECISQNCAVGSKACPLCRIKFNPKHILHLQFSLTRIENPRLNLDLNDSECQNVEILTLKLCESLQNNQSLSKKLENFEEQVKKHEATIKELKNNVNEEHNKFEDVEMKLFRTKSSLREQENEAQKYKKLFNDDHLKLREVEDKLTKLQSIQKLINDIEQTHSSVIWANSARESLPLEDQASQFYTALLVSTTNLKSAETKYKELRNIHSNCSDDIQKLKKLNMAMRKENERLCTEIKFCEVCKTGPKKIDLEQAGVPTLTLKKELKPPDQEVPYQYSIFSNSLSAPKKALSLLNKSGRK